jgi:diguanylate cyclase (GGDEF)-like protein/PAS domain S-box-containing protein
VTLRPIPGFRGRSSLRVLPMLVAVVAVIVGMIVMADNARQDADRARQAQVLMERVRTESEKVEALTWETMATTRSGSRPDPAMIAEALDAYRDLTASLRGLHRLGSSRGSVDEVETRVGGAYGEGLKALIMSRREPTRARKLALERFTPAMTKLDAAITVAARRQSDIAEAALVRGRIGSLGSLVGGLALLALLGWRLHRVQRRAAVREHARGVERRGEERLRALVRHSSDVVAVIDASSRVQWVAESVERVLGHHAAAITGRPLSDLVHPDDAHRAMRFLQHALEHEHAIERESLRLRTSTGAFRHVELMAENRLADPLVDGILINLRDVSQRIALEEQLRHQAFHDTLTGLANRALFEDRLTQALARERRHDGTMAVLFVDLDDFKTVNDTLGHAVGDALLQAVAVRLENILRPEDTAGRLGGDEFAVLIEELGDPAEALAVADRIQAAFTLPFEIGERSITAGVSIGVACPAPTTAPDDLLRNADVAMYAAKERGKGQAAEFEPEMYARVVERVQLNSDLDAALDNGEFALVYQPLVDLGTEAMVGVEALLRWHHPERGLVGPDRFIPLAETSGLIVPIGRWVLRTACEQLREWHGTHPAARTLELSVNVSTRQLADPAFPSEVRSIVADTGIDPGKLTLEITERLLADDSDFMLRQLDELKAIGVRLAIDDFGTGYSALSYLRTFPVDLLKIDRSFMGGIVDDEEKARLVRGIVDMGRALRLSIVTEGIEDADQAALMRELRSDLGQGYLFSPPVAPTAIERFLAEGLPSIHLPGVT